MNWTELVRRRRLRGVPLPPLRRLCGVASSSLSGSTTVWLLQQWTSTSV